MNIDSSNTCIDKQCTKKRDEVNCAFFASQSIQHVILLNAPRSQRDLEE